MTKLTWVTRLVILSLATTMLLSYENGYYGVAKSCLASLIATPWILLNIYSFKTYSGFRRASSLAPLILYILLYVVELLVSH